MKISINGKEYPLAFTLFFQSEFEDDTGITLNAVENLPESKASKVMLKLMYWALVDGSRKLKKADRFDLEYYDLVDAVESDPKIATAFSEILVKRAGEKKKEASEAK